MSVVPIWTNLLPIFAVILYRWSLSHMQRLSTAPISQLQWVWCTAWGLCKSKRLLAVTVEMISSRPLEFTDGAWWWCCHPEASGVVRLHILPQTRNHGVWFSLLRNRGKEHWSAIYVVTSSFFFTIPELYNNLLQGHILKNRSWLKRSMIPT